MITIIVGNVLSVCEVSEDICFIIIFIKNAFFSLNSLMLATRMQQRQGKQSTFSVKSQIVTVVDSADTQSVPQVLLCLYSTGQP